MEHFILTIELMNLNEKKEGRFYRGARYKPEELQNIFVDLRSKGFVVTDDGDFFIISWQNISDKDLARIFIPYHF